MTFFSATDLALADAPPSPGSGSNKITLQGFIAPSATFGIFPFPEGGSQFPGSAWVKDSRIYLLSFLKGFANFSSGYKISVSTLPNLSANSFHLYFGTEALSLSSSPQTIFSSSGRTPLQQLQVPLKITGPSHQSSSPSSSPSPTLVLSITTN